MICRILFSSLLMLFWAFPVAALERVELELVLAIDTSTSVDDDEFELQRTGLAHAFRQPNVQAAIASLGVKGMAICVVQWAGQGSQYLAIDWMRLHSKRDAERFADRLAGMNRQTRGSTDIAGALRFSTSQLLTNAYKGARLTIDVSGDGTNEDSPSAQDPRIFRDAAVGQGIIINGLVIFNDEYDLGDLASDLLIKHYRAKVIGGPGHFLEYANRFKDFAAAMQRKLIREIRGPAFVQQRQSAPG